jgi:hypothetical protein
MFGSYKGHPAVALLLFGVCEELSGRRGDSAGAFGLRMRLQGHQVERSTSKNRVQKASTTGFHYSKDKPEDLTERFGRQREAADSNVKTLKMRSRSIPPKLSSSQPARATSGSPRRVVITGGSPRSTPGLNRTTARPLTDTYKATKADTTASSKPEKIAASEEARPTHVRRNAQTSPLSLVGRALSFRRKTSQKSASSGQRGSRTMPVDAEPSARSPETPRGRRASSEPPLINPRFKKKQNRGRSAEGGPAISTIGMLPQSGFGPLPPLDAELLDLNLPANLLVDPTMHGLLEYVSGLEERHLRHKEEKKKWEDQKKVLLAEIDSLKEENKALREKDKA